MGKVLWDFLYNMQLYQYGVPVTFQKHLREQNLLDPSQLGHCTMLQCHLATWGVPKMQRKITFFWIVYILLVYRIFQKKSKWSRKIKVSFWHFWDNLCDQTTLQHGTMAKLKRPFDSYAGICKYTRMQVCKFESI